MSKLSYFSSDYFMARLRWRTAAILHHARLESYEIDAVTPSDERLTIGTLTKSPDKLAMMVNR